MTLAKLEGSRATYDTTVTQTPEGQYTFKLTEPTAKPAAGGVVQGAGAAGRDGPAADEPGGDGAGGPRQRGQVLQPGDSEEGMPEELPEGNRVSVNAAGPPFIAWNSVLLFALFLGVVGTEWLLRKLKNLL